MWSSPKISIVIPVFNGSSFIRKTLDSILAQDFTDYEVICVDDCSTDDSLDILNEYAASDKRFRVYATGKNLGYCSIVTKFGTQFIRGDYYAYASQDDLFSNNWLSCLYYRTLETGADAVIPDMVFFYENCPEKNILWSDLEALKTEVITGKRAFLYSLDGTIHNFALWSRRLIDEIGYYDFGMLADEYTYRVWFLQCNKVAFSSGTFYYRYDNSEAITQKLTLRSFDAPYNNFRLWKLAVENNAPYELQERLILTSIYELLYFNELTYSARFRNGKNKIAECYSAYLSENVSSFFNKSPITDRRLFAAKIAMQSYGLFTLLTFYRMSKGAVKSYLRSIKRHSLEPILKIACRSRSTVSVG